MAKRYSIPYFLKGHTVTAGGKSIELSAHTTQDELAFLYEKCNITEIQMAEYEIERPVNKKEESKKEESKKKNNKREIRKNK